jgi:hypothetical protein
MAPLLLEGHWVFLKKAANYRKNSRGGKANRCWLDYHFLPR